MQPITIAPLTSATDANVADINRLLPQLRIDPGESAATIAELAAIIADAASRVIVARDGERIIGFAMLHVVPTIGKRIGHVDNVVVDQAYRGRGLARQIMDRVAAEARGLGATHLKLTSRRTRIAANAMYPRLGFERTNSNVYLKRL